MDYPQEGTAYLGFFMTKKATQGRGIGSALIGELLDELRKASCKKVRLAVDRGNPQSKAFWEKNGFALTGEEFLHGDSAYLPMGTRAVKVKKHRCAEGICTAGAFHC